MNKEHELEVLSGDLGNFVLFIKNKFEGEKRLHIRVNRIGYEPISLVRDIKFFK